MSSEIFDNFIKIAQEKGMISVDTKPAFKKEAQPYRIDSMDIKDIEALYGVKTPTEDDMEYEHNIVEIAHPNAVVVAPSYDKLNGLVENVNERQNIILHILERTPTGMMTNHKYAKRELLSSLVSLGNDLDNHNKDELRVLADACLMQISAKESGSKKEAAAAAAAPAAAAAAGLLTNPYVLGAAAIAGTIGLLWLQQHADFRNEGIDRNHEKLIAELDNFLESNSNWGVGVDYKPSFIKVVNDFKLKLIKFYNLYKNFVSLIETLEKPKTIEELKIEAPKPVTTTVRDAFNTLKSANDNMAAYIETIQTNFKSEEYKTRQIQEKGALTDLVDKIPGLHGGKGVVSDDFDDVNRAIPPYKKSIDDILTLLSKAKAIELNAKEKIEAGVAASSKVQAPTLDQTTTEQAPDVGAEFAADIKRNTQVAPA